MSASYSAARLAVLLVSLIIYLTLRRTFPERSQPIVAGLVVLLLGRDLAYLATGAYQLLPLGDIALVIGLELWLDRAAGHGRRLIPWLLFALVVVGVGVAELMLSNGLPRLVYLLPLAVACGWLILQFYDITADSVDNSRLITEVRPPVCYGLFYAQVALAVLGHDSLPSQLVVYPLFYLIPIRMLLGYFERGKQDSAEYVRSMRRESESLFSFMRRVSASMAGRVDLESTLNVVLSSAMSDTGADGGTVWLLEGENNDDRALKLRALQGVFPPPVAVPAAVKRSARSFERYLRSLSIAMGETPIGQAALQRVAVFIPDTLSDSRFAANTNREDLSYISSFVALPLTHGPRVLGVLALLKRRPGVRFSERDFEHLQTFADYATLAIETVATYLELLEKREVERELAIAADIQRQMVPERLPDSSTAEFAASALPARGVGGDYYDVFALSETLTAAIICDVAGKGIPAALLMVMVRTMVRFIAAPQRDSGETLRLMNAALAGQLAEGHYATVGLFIHDAAAGELSYSNAAHHPLLVYHRDSGTLVQYDTEGLPVGIEGEVQYPTRSIPVGSNDLVVMYTDGITEALSTDGEQFGAARLEALIEKVAAGGAGVTAEAVRSAISAEVATFTGGARPHDDQTLLVMRVR